MLLLREEAPSQVGYQTITSVLSIHIGLLITIVKIKKHYFIILVAK